MIVELILILVCSRVFLKYVDDIVVFYEFNEGENMIIDCIISELVYYIVLFFYCELIFLFYLVLNGKKFI